MMSNNKVLTVSYGAFSCTLEGFEDSFGTMKAIAEYFRDLASEDRYFGAVPPQPDADMLARIAEREVARRVDARSEDGRIVLTSAAPAAAEPAPAVEDPTPIAPEPVEALTVVEPVVEQPVAEDTQAIVEEVETAEPDVDTAPEIDTGALARAMADSLPAGDDAEQVADIAPVIEDAADEGASDTVEENVVEAQEAQEVSLPEIVDEETVEDEASIAVAELVEVDPVPPAPTDMSDKLERIRAVVAQSREATEDDEFSEDNDVEALPDATAADTTDETETALEALLDERADQVAEAALSGDDTLEADKALLAGLDDAGEAEADDNLFEDEDLPSEPRARIIKVKRADMEAAIAAGDIDGPEDLARMLDEGALEEVSSEEVSAESTLSAEDEADLLRELAEVEGELDTPEDADFESGLDDAAEAVTAEDATSIDADTDTEEDDIQAARSEIVEGDVDRLLAETDEKMDEPEGSRARNAFRQLRAAVVARNADEDLQRASDGDGDENAYRSDLAEVVRPRRPAASGEGTERPRAPAAAPLKLVAEQRVDVDHSAETQEPAAITPRRISADMAAADPDGGFAEFASEVGAHALPELLEAAASYMSFVEGRDNFSRPQLMHKVRQIDPDDFRREDGLRSFGQLLREGKIEKLEGGRFAATGDIGFKPRRAAS